ncbi:MAG: tetratricopeptide repeat protein [Archangium sp.]|nr:tetratricopeptide repeat protein [Archangium sp.]
MAVDIEPLLQKMADLAPRFGRAQEDLQTMVSRGRARDYKGVMQNARLVLEAILRSLVTEELKQTPGKAMLDELVTKFRQQANAGIIPTNVLAHMSTVQAWGNLSAHDHAGSLDDSGVKVGLEEVVASLNSMVTILAWYSEKKGLTAPGAATTAPAAAQLAPAAPKKPGSKVPLLAGGAVLLGVIGAAVVALSPGAKKDPVVTPPPQLEPFTLLDTVYSTWKEPVPPVACRRAEDAAQVAKVATDHQALALIEKPSAEAAYLLARATHTALKQTSPALQVALACPGFAAAQHLAGLVAVREGRLPDAQKYYEEARRLAPGWLDNRTDLAGLLVNTQQTDEARKEVDGIIAAAPDHPPGYLLRGVLKNGEGDKAGAAEDLCRAVKLGSAQARSLVDNAGIKCP